MFIICEAHYLEFLRVLDFWFISYVAWIKSLTFFKCQLSHLSSKSNTSQGRSWSPAVKNPPANAGDKVPAPVQEDPTSLGAARSHSC